jgi:integrase
LRQQLFLGVKPKKTWAEAELRWLNEMKHKRSIYEDIRQFEWLQHYLSHLRLEDINKDKIEELASIKEKNGVKPSTVNRMLALIRAVLNKSHRDWEWIDRVPYIRMRKEDNCRTRWLTQEEANRLLKELPPHLRVMAKFTLATGLRASNVSNLKWQNVDIFRRHLIVEANENKNGKYLGIPLNQEAIDVLKQQMGKHPIYVFVYQQKPVTQCSTRAWRNALERAGIKDFRWHDLRHTWASWHVQNGTSLQELCDMGGWANIEMVLRYAHLSKTQLRIAAERICGEKVVQSELRLIKNG